MQQRDLERKVAARALVSLSLEREFEGCFWGNKLGFRVEHLGLRV